MKLGITGDMHGDPYFQQIYKARKLGYSHLMVCGDFTYIWDGSVKEQRRIDYMSKIGLDILFVDGNHENHVLLNQYPVVEIYGGKAHKIRDNIYHLMRGEIYTIEGKKFFTFGGANSTDMVYYNMYGKRKVRVEGKNWWKEEKPTVEEGIHALDKLSKSDWKVDYIITHTAFPKAIVTIGGDPKRIDDLAWFLHGVQEAVEYNKWYFGHFHTNHEIVDAKAMCLYKNIEEIKLED